MSEHASSAAGRVEPLPIATPFEVETIHAAFKHLDDTYGEDAKHVTYDGAIGHAFRYPTVRALLGAYDAQAELIAQLEHTRKLEWEKRELMAARIRELESRPTPSAAGRVEPLPCPFAHSDTAEDATPEVVYEDRLDAFYVRCPECGACGAPYNSEDGAIKGWNTRVESRPTPSAASEAEADAVIAAFETAAYEDSRHVDAIRADLRARLLSVQQEAVSVMRRVGGFHGSSDLLDCADDIRVIIDALDPQEGTPR